MHGEGDAVTGFLKNLVLVVVMVLAMGATLEMGLRLAKSIFRDGGTITLHRSSINSQYDAKYGWFTPRAEVVVYSRACFGDIKATYNAQGMRRETTPKLQKETNTKRICVVGDSTTQGHQLSDGKPYYHLLAEKFSSLQFDVEILPMAVGGFGTLQQSMLLQEFCMSYDPDLIIWQADANDIINNNYELERYLGRDNNFRRRPYFEDGAIAYRRPMLLPDWVDSLALRLVNAMLTRWFVSDPQRAEASRQQAYEQTKLILDDFLGPVEVPVLFFFTAEESPLIRTAFLESGFKYVPLAAQDSSNTCAHAGDGHYNAAGHEFMAEALFPEIECVLWKCAEASKENPVDP